MKGIDKKKLTLRLDSEAIEQAKVYAIQHDTSLSRLVEAYFQKLVLREPTKHTPLVKKLTGILPADLDVEQAHRAYLLEKYGS